jgi:DNA-binding LytR/AlgR family response regulator
VEYFNTKEMEPPKPVRLLISKLGVMVYARSKDIILLEGDGNCTRIYVREPLGPEPYSITTIGKHLKRYDRLFPDQLIRISGKYIINPRYLTDIRYRKQIKMKHLPSDKVLILTDKYRKDFFLHFTVL